MTQNGHIYAICYRQEVDDHGISSENVKTLVGYAVLNLEFGSSGSFRDSPKSFRDGIGFGGGHYVKR